MTDDVQANELAEIEAKLEELAEIATRILELTRRISDLAIRVYEVLVGPVDVKQNADDVRAPPKIEEDSSDDRHESKA